MSERRKKKGHLIAFRVDEEVFEEVRSRALLAGKGLHEWSRDEFLAMLVGGTSLTANEELIHSEILSANRVLLNGFNLLAAGKLTPENWKKVIETVKGDRKEMAQKYFASLAEGLREEGK